MAWYFYTGLVAAVCVAAFTIPQLVQVLKTKNTCGLSVLMLALLVFGDFMFIVSAIGQLTHGEISAGLPLLLANIIADTTSGILLFLKLRAMYYAKKFGTTEKLFCDNYQSYKTKIKMARAEKAASKAISKPAEPEQPAQPIVG
ncbi:MAG: hypothetical protein KBS35_02000 [Mycoplasma sp.]|nr:hypothetical protein [Candidatus Hennigella equi]